MAKYKITSIPQFAPGGETNWPPDWMLNIMQNQRKVKLKGNKKLKKSSRPKSSNEEELDIEETPVQTSGFDSPVEGVVSNTPLSAFMPNESMVDQSTQYTIDPIQQDVAYNQRTGLEQLATQPSIGGGYGYIKDPNIPVDAQGNPLNCPPGSRPYNGVCVTDEEFQQIKAEEEANLLYREEQEAKRIAEEERLKAEEEQRLFDAKVKEREVYFQSKKKHDKLDPFDTMPYDVYENALKLNPDFKNQLKQQGFYADVKKDDGIVNLFPVNEINDRILKNGLKTGEIVNKLGIGNTEDIDTEFKDVFKYADDYHNMQSKQFVQDYMIKYNLTLDQAIAKVVKDKKLAKDAATLKKIYNTDFQDIDKKVTEYRKQVENYNTAQRAYKAYGEDYVPPYKKYKGLELRDKWTDDDIITLARDREFLDSYGYNIGTAGAAGYSDNEYGAQIHTLVRSGKWGWKPKTGELVRLDKDPAYKPLAKIADKVVQPEDIQLKKFTKDYLGLSDKEFKSKYRPNSVELQEKWKEGKVPVQIEDVKEWRPYRTYDPNKGVAGTFYSGYYVDVPSHVDPMTGEVITKKVSVEDLAGQQVYMTSEEAEKYNKNMMRDNMEYFRNSPLYYLPGAIGMGGALLGTANRALSIPLLRAFGSEALPQLTGHTVLNSYFAYEALKPDGQVDKAYKAFKEGDVGKGVENTIWAGLGLYPFLKPGYQMLKAVNELKKPGSLSVLPMSGNYSLAYKTPLQSGLVVGNPNIGQASEVFTGLTNPLNKFTKYANLGEFKIMKGNTGGLSGDSYYIGNISNILNNGKTAAQTVETVPKTIDTTVPLYRHEVPGYVPAESKTASEYHDWDYGPVSEMDEAEIAEAMSNPASIRYVDENGIERIGVFFPQHTAGKWWSSQKIGEEGAPTAVNTFVFDPITGEYVDKASEMVHLETKVPFSKLEQYNVVNDPAAKEFAGMSPEHWQKQFILPDEYKESAKIYEPFNQSRVPTQGTASTGPAQTQPSVSDLDIDKPIINIDEALKNEATQISATEIKPEIESIFKAKPEIENIGSKNEYAQYIEETYPEYNLLYHGTESKIPFDEFKGNPLGIHTGTKEQAWWRLDDNAWFEGLDDASLIPKELESQIFPVAVNPKEYIKGRDYLEAERLINDETGKLSEKIYDDIYNTESAADDEMRKLAVTFYYDGTLTKEQAKQLIKNNDISYVQKVTGKKGYYYENQGEMPGQMSYVSFNPEEVTKLGSNKDIEGFKEWKLKKDQLELSYFESDNAFTAKVIDDVYKNKIELYQTPEGQKRLQKLIDNTPSLKNETPKTLFRKLASMTNRNAYYEGQAKLKAGLERDIERIEMEYNAGRMSKEQLDAYIAPIQEKINRFEESMKNTREMFSRMSSNGYYNNPTNEVGIKPGSHTVNDIKNITAHEIVHPFAFLGGTDEVTYIDKILEDLSLIENTDEQLKIPGFEGVAEETKVHHNMGWGKPGYLKRSLDYFKTGSKGREKMPFLAEVRQDMLNKGIITSEYEPISTEMLQKHYENYKNMQGEKYPLRLYDILNPKDADKNFNILKEAINWLPSVVAIGAVGAEALNDESGVSQAGLNEWQFLLIAGAALGAGKFISPKFRNLFNKYQKQGFEYVKNVVASDKKLAKAIDEAKVVYDDLTEVAGYSRDTGFRTPKTFIGPLPPGLAQKEFKAQQALKQKEFKVGQYIDNKLLPTIETPKGIQKLGWTTTPESQRIAREDKNQPYYDIEKEYTQIPTGGVEKQSQSMFDKTTTTGRKLITDLTTGEQIQAEVSFPKTKMVYTKKDGKLVVSDESIDKAYMTPEYVKSLEKSRTAVETDIPGSIVFGSSVLVAKVGMPHLTGDLDVLISEGNYNKFVKDKYTFVQDYGPAKQHSIFPKAGQEGVLDFNIIHENPDGTVRPFFDPNLPDKTPTEIELFRQFHPDKFQEAAKKSILSGKPLEINMHIDEFMKGIDPEVKTIIDSYEAGPITKWGQFKANKNKHVLKPDVLIGYGDPEIVAKGQEAFVKSVVGSKGTLGYQFPKSELEDVEKNVDALIEMGFRGDNLMDVAQSPERMQLALNDFYINSTIYSREINPARLKELTGKLDIKSILAALTEWHPDAAGGSMNGYGLNTVKLGNPAWLDVSQNPIIGHRQLGIKLDNTNVKDYVKSIVRATDGSYVFTNDEVKDLYNIFNKYVEPELTSNWFPDSKLLGKEKMTSEEILKWRVNALSTKGTIAQQKGVKKALDEMADKMGIRAISKVDGTYGNSLYASLFGKLDETLDAIMFAHKDVHVAPKSMYQRKEALTNLKNSKNKNWSNVEINTLGDLQKIENILNGGISTAEQRLHRLEDQVALIQKQKQELLKKAYPKEHAEHEALIQQGKELVEKLNAQKTKIDELENMRKKARYAKSLLLPIGIGAATIGATAYLFTEQEDQEEARYKKIQRVNKARSVWRNERGVNEITTKKYGQETFDYLMNNPNATTWPNGDPIEIKTTKGKYYSDIELPTPAQMNKKVDEVKMSDTQYYKQYYDGLNEQQKKRAAEKNDFKTTLEKENSNTKIRKQKLGGQNAMELELTQKEIDDMVKRGYVVIAE